MIEQTIQILQQSLASNPQDFALRCHLAELLCSAERQHEVPALFVGGAQRLWPQEEEAFLQVAKLLAAADVLAALALLDEWLARDKACAKAYLAKAEIYRAQDASPSHFELAKKNYSVATVIDESLQSSEWEAWIERGFEHNGGEGARDDGSRTNSSVDTSSFRSGQGNDEQNLPSSPSSLPSSSPPPITPYSASGVGFDAPRSSADSEANMGEFEGGFEEEYAGQSEQLDELFAAQNQIDFSQVGGMEEVKERVRMSIIYPFQNKELFAKFKKRTGGGILFYGPPGCGKTLISRATAGECGANFIEVSIFDILSRYIGEAESRLHSLFETARRKAPTIIFIDEVDALGVKRSDAGNSASVVNTLLTEIDGASSHNEDLLVIGATNTPWRVDSAFRRPGRFDHVLFVPPPDAPARESIFRLSLDGVPQENLNFAALAKASEKFSGADIRAVVERATEEVLSEMMKTGKEAKLTNKQLTKALKKHRPTTLEWLEQATNYASYANQSGLYDELSEYLQKGG